jgi:hypothetical protein
MPVSKETAEQIAYAYREVETAEKLLAEISEALSKRETPDIRDAFGRRQRGLQFGVPSGDNGHRLFDVPWTLAKPVIEAHIAHHRAIINTLSERVWIEHERNLYLNKHMGVDPCA